MATRPAFYIYERIAAKKETIRKKDVDFTWVSGLAVSQKQKSIKNLHQALGGKALEVSTKSEVDFGKKLSAFNLRINGYTLENIFQSSKTFEKGGPYLPLLDVAPKDAKRDPRLANSGKLVGFTYDGFVWPLEPKSVFYDYIYCKAVRECVPKEELADILNYDYFTDIEFNPAKSINTQARTAALVKFLVKNFGEIPELNPEEFIRFHAETVRD